MSKIIITLFCVCLACVKMYAQQTCVIDKKGLGDPLLDERFPFGVDLTSFSSGYTPSVECPAAGTYSMVNVLRGCIYPYDPNNSDLSNGNQNDVNGQPTNVMVVNVGINRGIIYQRRFTKNICGNTAYLFEALVMNFMSAFLCDSNALSPSVIFTVQSNNGDTIKQLNTGPLLFVSGTNPNGTYKTNFKNDYCLLFTTPASATGITITISSATPTNYCGTYIGIDDLWLSPWAPVSTTLNGYDQYLTGICNDNTDPIILKAFLDYYKNPEFTWQVTHDSGRTFQDIPGQTNDSLILTGLDTGAHTYRLQVAEKDKYKDAFCRINVSPKTVIIQQAPAKPVPVIVNACLNHRLTIAGNAGAYHKWLAPDGSSTYKTDYIINPVTLKDTGLYVATEKYGQYCTIDNSYVVKVFPPPGLAVPASYKVCEGSSVQLSATGDGTFLWQPATGLNNTNIPNPYATITNSQRYKVYLTNSVCTDSARVTVEFIKKMQVSAGPDKYILTGDSVNLTAAITGGVESFHWSPSAGMINGNTLKPLVRPVTETTYTLNATAANGCGSGSDDIIVYVYNDVYIPNAFTPNGDGKNDVFIIPPFSNLKVKHLSIYNRWGKLVFNNTKPGIYWDGTIDGIPQPIGAYIYFIELVTPKGRLISRKGTLMLIR